ncbi:MAG: diadenylate cyclase [Patescibacteria group bacterium]|jgi:DNA integrity scanning protein DisA with diadenylate cyclase activity
MKSLEICGVIFYMGFDVIAHYLESGWQALMGEAALNWVSLASVLNLAALIDIILVVLLLWWVWSKVKNTPASRMLLRVLGILPIMFLAKLFGLAALFYISAIGFVVMVIALGVIYQQDFRNILDGKTSYARLARKNLTSGEYNAKKFLTELTDAVTLLAKSKIPSLIIVKTDLPLDKLAEKGTYLCTPFSKEFVWDIFSHRSKLSAGAMLVDNGVIVAAGSTLTTNAPKRFSFNLSNAAIQQVAAQYEAIIIITHKDKEDVSVLHRKSSYAKLAPKNLDRVLKTILLG